MFVQEIHFFRFVSFASEREKERVIRKRKSKKEREKVKRKRTRLKESERSNALKCRPIVVN